MSTLTMIEILAKKESLTEAIFNLVQTFEQETNTQVHSIGVSHVELTEMTPTFKWRKEFLLSNVTTECVF